MEIALSIGGTVVAMLALWFVYINAACGNFGRYARALSLLKDPEFDKKSNLFFGPPTPPKPSGEPLRLLTLMQREGRLLDFLLEEVGGYTNDQIGAAVRDIHRNCQKVLKEHLVLEPVLTGQEGGEVQVAPNFDPATIRLTGNVTGQPPFKGTLQHHGWKVREIKLAKLTEGQDLFIVQPAEVELS